MDIFVIYASTSGNVESVVEFGARLLSEAGHTPFLSRAEKTSPEVIHAHQHFLLATSTWEHGRLNPFFVPLLKEMKLSNLEGKHAAFIGLGDTRYEPVLFCHGMITLREIWLKQSGSEIGSPLKINGEPYAQLETVVAAWFKEISPLFSS